MIFALVCLHGVCQNKYRLNIRCLDKDSAVLVSLGLENVFASRSGCTDYIGKLPELLRSKGYISASIDSLVYDSAQARAVLFLGEPYRWASINTSQVNPSLLDAVGWRDRTFPGKALNMDAVTAWQEKILSYLATNGHPFAKVYLDSFEMSDDNRITASLHVDEGPQYRVDSIRVFGNVKLAPNFLHHYLDIRDGADYDQQKLQQISKKLMELTYVEEEKPSDISMLPTGSVLNLYLKQKRSSQVNVLFGFLPNNEQTGNNKLLITGEGNLNLKNALGAGETIAASFQKLQVRSERLNLGYQHPYLFNSPVGLDFAFDMYRGDSVYLNVNLQFGANYIFSSTRSGKLYLQHFQTIANGLNTATILQTHRLPDEGDVSTFNLGLDYTINTTDYLRNPRRGNELFLSATVGTKKIRINDQVATLKDPSDSSFDFKSLYDTIKMRSYQFRVRTTLAHYLPVGRQATVKVMFNGGVVQSPQLFRNELFQIGGFRLLRGFDEESQYVSQYAIATVEYHYLISQNSYFYALSDGGWARNKSQNAQYHHTYLSAGIGLAFETKVGIFNLAWAVGQREDVPFNLRQSKIHFGFVNYF